MEPRAAASPVPDHEAVEFIRFCYQRRRVGWPELYDEMCAVAARGLFRGYGSDDLAGFGIGFSLFEMPSLAAMSARVVAEEQARRRPVSVTIRAEAGVASVASAEAIHGVAGVEAALGNPSDVAALTDEVIVEVPIAPSALMVPVRTQPLPVMAEPDRGAAAPVRLSLAPTRA